MQQKIKILGIISVTLGVLSALLVIVPYGLFLSLPAGFLGMLSSTAYVYLDTKYMINTKKMTPGIIGIFLSSIPIIIVLAIIIMNKK